MSKIDALSVDLAFADPPFNIGYNYDVYEDRMQAEEYLDWTRQWGEGMVKRSNRRHILAGDRRRFCGRAEADLPARAWTDAAEAG